MAPSVRSWAPGEKACKGKDKKTLQRQGRRFDTRLLQKPVGAQLCPKPPWKKSSRGQHRCFLTRQNVEPKSTRLRALGECRAKVARALPFHEILRAKSANRGNEDPGYRANFMELAWQNVSPASCFHKNLPGLWTPKPLFETRSTLGLISILYLSS